MYNCMSFFKWFLRREPEILQLIEASAGFDLFSMPSEKESLVSSKQLKTWYRALTKLLVKILPPFLLRCYLLLFKCCVKLLFTWLMKYIFRSAESFSKFLLTWGDLFLKFSCYILKQYLICLHHVNHFVHWNPHLSQT